MTEHTKQMPVPARRTRVPGFATPHTDDPPPTPTNEEPHHENWSRTGSVQANLRLRLPLHRRYRELLRELDQEGFDTTLTEIIHALLHHHGPRDTVSAKDLVRAWRRTIAP